MLLLTEAGVVKTQRFKSPRYVGDPINALRIFNEKEVDEIVILDIEATLAGRGPDFDRICDLASECFMPMAYGGGIRSAADVERLFSIGVEKVILGTIALNDPQTVRAVATIAGAQSVVVCLDVRRRLLGGSSVYVQSGRCDTRRAPVDVAREMEDLGAGEIILQSIDRDGLRQGYDTTLISTVAESVQLPVVACGGAGNLADLREAFTAGASAAAAGSLFVFYGRHRAVLITYPRPDELKSLHDSTY